MQPVLARLFALTGQAAPEPKSTAGKLLAKCPRERLVRAVSWYALEQERCRHRPYVLVEGTRALVRGWSDLYEVDAALRDAPLVTGALPPGPGQAIAIRHARWGKGWAKPATPYVAVARPEAELAHAWLASVAGCVLHDDCLLDPELGAACFEASLEAEVA